MPTDITVLKNTYFVQQADANLPSEPIPMSFSGCRITPLIDGTSYFGELDKVFTTVGNNAKPEQNAGHFIYISGWWIHLLGGEVRRAPGSVSPVGSVDQGPQIGSGRPFALDGLEGNKYLIDILKTKSRAGVDVRVLGWLSWAVMSSSIALHSAPSLQDVSAGTLAAIDALRQEPTLSKKACLNTLAHTAGGSHTKMVLIGNGNNIIGFTGGIDFVENRHSDRSHTSTRDYWHDIQAKIEGPAVQSMYNLFRDLWNELLPRSQRTFRLGEKIVYDHVDNTPQVESRNFTIASAGSHHVQSLRTLPQFNYKFYNILPSNSPLSFAPDGIFEVRTAWRKAILAASSYIYVEDQSFWSREIMDWINESVRRHPNLKVILLTGTPDPSDPPLPAFAVVALVDHLIKGLNQNQRNQIRFFARAKTVVHSKTTIIDDNWLIIGSANFMRRSLYSDIEHAVSVLDEAGQLASKYRIDLWGDHFGLSSEAERAKISNLDHALNVWEGSWGQTGSTVSLPSSLIPIPIPAVAPEISDSEQDKYDSYIDLDSRENWGGCYP